MASYLQPDIIPHVTPFQPDLGFLQSALSTKQAQYQAGYDQLSKLYGTLLNSPLTNPENIDRRDKFFTQIANDIHKISSLDLSKQENIDAAYKVFDPLIEDKYLIKDMSFTKASHNELDKAEGFRNCLDEKKCGGKYWDGGVRAIQYKMKEFADSSLQDTLKIDAPRFTPNRNVDKEAIQFAKDMGFSVENVSWSPDGKYMVTTKNGVQVIPELTDLFLSIYKNEPGVSELYQTKGYLKRKDFIYQNAPVHGSEEAAEKYYIDQLAPSLLEINTLSVENAEKAKDKAATQESLISEIIKRKGVDPNNPDDRKLIEQYNQSIEDQLIAVGAKEAYVKNTEILDPETFNTADLYSQRLRIDDAVANGLLATDLFNAARGYANMTSSIKVEADPYSLASFNHSLKLKELIMENELDKDSYKYKTSLDILKKSYEDGGPLGNRGGFDGNQWMPLETSPGGSAVDPNLIESDKEYVTDIQSSAVNANKGLSDNFANQLIRILNTKDNDPVGLDAEGNVIVASKALREYAKNTLIDVFGKEDAEASTKEVVVDSGTSTWDKVWGGLAGIASSVIPLGGMIAPAIAGGITKSLSSPKKETITTYSGGLWNSQTGNLVDLSKSPDFTNPEGKYNYKNVNSKIETFLKTSPLANDLFLSNSTFNASLAEARVATSLANDAEKINRNNLNGAQAVVSQKYFQENPSITSYDKKLLDNYTKFRSKEEFVYNYVKNHPGVEKVSNPRVPNPLRPDGFVKDEKYARERGEDLYDDYTNLFTKVFNQVDSPVPFKGYVSPIGGFKSSGGAGVFAKPVTMLNIDTAFPGEAGAQAYLSFYRDLKSSISNPSNKSGISVINGEYGGLSSDELDDVIGTQDEKALQVLDLLYSDFSNKTNKDKERGMFDMTVYPIAGNNVDLRAVTFKLNPQFIDKNDGTNKNKGITSGTEAVTVILDKSAISKNNKLFNSFDLGIYGTKMLANNNIVIDAFSYAGGTLSMTENPNGGYIIDEQFKYVDENGNLKNYTNRSLTSPESDISDVDNIILPKISLLQEIERANIESLRMSQQNNKNKIKDPNQLIVK